ncbi:(d)CMP kinase [Verrucomicrobiales bacterium]|jgi:CMP/dCMP kinase|nr:(d)CMP kinase [Verrucomicrobiales bacterium]
MSNQAPLIIAIDGPAASGKSTVAKRIAAELEAVFVNSGAMYRAFTWWVLENEVDPSDPGAVVALLGKTQLESGESDRVGTVSINGKLMSRNELSEERVNSNVSAVASVPEVRERLVSEQREYAESNSVVMEGRDIGSVVFPDTPYKFYIDASPEVREQRRRAEGIEDSILARDKQDSSRKASPLVIPDDAIVVDSSHMGVDEVVGAVLMAIREKQS